jgi:DUF1009 family protein
LGRLALIAGRGALPDAVVAARAQAGESPPLICALEGQGPDHLRPDLTFRVERLGSLLRDLRRAGVDRVCLCGAVDRPALSWKNLDLRTLPLVPAVLRALKRGDDGALRIVMGLFEDAGLKVLGAHEAAPDLLPAPGVIGDLPDTAARDAALGDQISAQQGAQDLGQSCVIRDGAVIAREDDAGTDAMLAGLTASQTGSGVFYKAPKPGQDRRADLPVIGPDTVSAAARAGLSALVIEAGGVMILQQDQVLARLSETGLALWVRERDMT